MKLISISLCILVLTVLLKEKNKTFSIVLSLFGLLLLLYKTLDFFKDIAERINKLMSPFESSSLHIKILFKVLIIVLLAQIVSDLCRDNGENALAGVTETVTKATVIIMVFPLFESVISIVSGMIK